MTEKLDIVTQMDRTKASEEQFRSIGEMASRSKQSAVATDYMQDGEFKVAGVSFWAKGDRVIVIEDPFKSGYECKTCGGSGKLDCADCDNGKSRNNQEITCKTCSGTRKFTCEDCKGKGALIILPQKSMRRPTTGTIMSCGAMVGFKLVGEKYQKMESYAVGERVMYGSFAGHTCDLEWQGKEIIVRILHDSELLCKVEGHLQYRRVPDDEAEG